MASREGAIGDHLWFQNISKKIWDAGAKFSQNRTKDYRFTKKYSPKEGRNTLHPTPSKLR